METLLVIDIVNSAGLVLLQSVWAETADLRVGRRRTDVEQIADPAIMQHRVRELIAQIYEPITLAAAALKTDELVGKRHPPRVIPKTAA
jgi:hypothetical protein